MEDNFTTLLNEVNFDQVVEKIALEKDKNPEAFKDKKVTFKLKGRSKVAIPDDTLSQPLVRIQILNDTKKPNILARTKKELRL